MRSRASRSRGGLALVDPEPGEVIAFNAAPGAVGVEDAGDYGVYAKALAGLMRQGGVDINEVLAQVRIKVNQDTQGAQLPWSAGKLDAPYFLFERAPDAPPLAVKAPPRKPLKQLPRRKPIRSSSQRDRLEDYEEFMRDHARSEQARRIEAILAARREALFWRRTLEQNSPRAYWTYLQRYPKGPHAYDADRRLDGSPRGTSRRTISRSIEYDDLPPPPPREIEYADRPVYYFGGDDFGPPPPPPPRDYVIYDEDDDATGATCRRRRRRPSRACCRRSPSPFRSAIAARAYYGSPGRDGQRARRPPPPPPPRPLGPPPLPRGVQVIERPEAAVAPRQAPPPGAAGQVKFAAPQPAAAAGGRPPRARSSPPPPTPRRLPSRRCARAAAAADPGARLPSRRRRPSRSPLPTPASATPGATPEPTHAAAHAAADARRHA